MHAAIGLTILLVATLIYWPGLHGPFVLDDGENITLNKAITIATLDKNTVVGALLANESGIFKRPLASLTFALNAYFANGVSNSTGFKAVNIFIHNINAILAYFLSLKLLATPALRKYVARQGVQTFAAVVALVWMIHPIQLTSVLYVVQRMTSLSAMFMLGGLIGFLHGRLLQEKGKRGGMRIAIVSVVLGTILGLGAKENAVLLPLLVVVIEFALFASTREKFLRRKPLMQFYAVIVLLPTIIGVLCLAWNPTLITDAYLGRDFTMWERVITEARVLWFYVLIIFLPNPRWLGLFHDDIQTSVSLFDPLTTLIAIIFWCGLLVWALSQNKKFPLMAFAVLWFLTCHALESTIVGLEIAYEHRNYLATFGLVFAVTLGMTRFFERTAIGEKLRLTVVALIFLVFGATTWNRALAWSSATTLSHTEVRNHPLSSRAHDFAARVALQSEANMIVAVNHTLTALRLKPNESGFHIDLHILLTVLAKEVNDQITKSGFSAASNKHNVAIQGLSENVRAHNRAGVLHLNVAESDVNIIENLLQNNVISVHTVFSLDNLRRCVLTPPYACRDLHGEAARWHLVASNNARMREDRAILFHNLALLYAHAGDYGRALQFIEKASGIAPNRIGYRLGIIEYTIRTGKIEKARELLMDIERYAAYASEDNRAAIRQLESMASRPMQGK